MKNLDINAALNGVSDEDTRIMFVSFLKTCDVSVSSTHVNDNSYRHLIFT
jgi:hypothetical protein